VVADHLALERVRKVVTAGGVLHLRGQQATLDAVPLALSAAPLAMLRVLADSPGEVVDRHRLLAALPGSAAAGWSRRWSSAATGWRSTIMPVGETLAAADAPVLIGCGHGTRDPAGRRALAQLRLDVAALRGGLRVLAANVDVQKPELDDVVARQVATGRRCVVVPLLLSAGYHVAVDIARAVRASGGLAVAADALGPDEVLVDVLVQRLTEAGVPPQADVLLAAAGSSDARAVADVETVAGALSARRGGGVHAAYLSAAQPSVDAEVARLRAAGRPVAIATYLLAPGFFADRLVATGAERVSAPLAPHPLLAELVLQRYDQARCAASAAAG
jgi:sirohydrochlorin ferrochelatase